MKRWRTHSTVAATCCLLLVSGGVAPAAQNEQNNLDDRDITIAVDTELILEEGVPSHKIDVSTDDGIVTLAGSVDSYYAKLEAEDAAESVKGVLAVVNHIEVEPQARLDSQIRGDIVSALAVDPVTESFEIDVSVEDGVATLSGEVESYSEKSVAEDVAQSVKGVRDVKNLISYDVPTDRGDADIKADIEHRLRSDASVDSSLITVNVDDGNVTLTGTTGSAVEKSEAQTEAWMVPGVESVVNEINVKWWLDGEADDWPEPWTDRDMEEAVEEALATNPRVKSFNVITTVEEGVATLTGTVDNLEAKRAAENEAEDVLGVWRVKNHLRVRPPLGRSDDEIAGDVRDALRRDPYVDRYDVTVSVYNGKAYLSGQVPSWFMKNEAEEAAAGVRGVVDIQNNLDVDYQPTAKSDAEIKEDINDQMWWSPFVDADEVNVEVHSGVATLTGTVDDWNEVQAAKENAREGGATSVVSHLKIENGYGPG